jgi:hypothetical protein
MQANHITKGTATSATDNGDEEAAAKLAMQKRSRRNGGGCDDGNTISPLPLAHRKISSFVSGSDGNNHQQKQQHQHQHCKSERLSRQEMEMILDIKDQYVQCSLHCIFSRPHACVILILRES